jgi:hypothetical protein
VRDQSAEEDVSEGKRSRLEGDEWGRVNKKNSVENRREKERIKASSRQSKKVSSLAL